MKLNSTCMYNYTYTAPKTSFKGKTITIEARPTTAPLQRIAPWVFSGALMMSGVSCTDNKGISELENNKGITVEYSNVSRETRDSVMKPVFELQKKLPQNNFLTGTKFDIANSFLSMNGTDSFKEYVRIYESDKTYRGTSFYSDALIQKRIAVQEAAFHNKKDKFNAMRQTVMHEVGHLFDNYYGHDHNADFARQWDSIMFNHANQPAPDVFTFKTTGKEREVEQYYYQHNALSDKEEFQNALYHDINEIKNKKELPSDIDYYVKDTHIKIGITREQLKNSDGIRSEIYANLFSYLTGQNDGNREKFLNCFTHSSKIVERDMKKYLKLIK